METQQSEIVVEEQNKPTLESLMAENEKLKTDLKVVAEHKEKLYKETKEAKQARDKASADAKRIEEEKAKKDGEFERLYQTKAQELQEKDQAFENFKKSVRQDKLQVTAMRIANDLADGDNAELLSDFIARKLDGLSDETGALNADVISDIKKEFASNQKYKSLLRASKANGGDARGNASGMAEGQNREISRADFDKLDPIGRSKFLSNRSNKITD